ncbi:MAG: serine hydrolase, partial [Spirulinaceae cyanobacterium]
CRLHHSLKDQFLAAEQPFPIFSITKTYLATLTLLLQEQGHLQLAQTLDRWFPNVPQATQITIRHLLNHTSGLPNYRAQAAYNEGHGGCGPGYMTIVRCWPERQTVAVLFSNTDEQDVQTCFYRTVKGVWAIAAAAIKS